MTQKTEKSGSAGRIPELDGLRVLMIFIVSWYHIWQQSWLTPSIRLSGIGVNWSLDFLVRSGYIWVDGTVLLSAFLLYLPLARKGRAIVPDVKAFYFRKAKRLLPAFWFIVLLFFFGMCLPWGLYNQTNGGAPFAVKDLFTHLTLIFPYFRDTYIYTPMGAAPWTLSLVAQGYLLFPLLAKAMKKHPWITLGVLACCAWGFRAWCLWAMKDYSMVVNTFANFLDVYAAGFAAALIFVKLEALVQKYQSTKALVLRQAAATVVFIGCLVGICELLKVQCRYTDHPALQAHQQIFRPLFALGFTGLILSAPHAVKPLRKLLGNKVTFILSAVSMNYYLIHQTLAVHLKRMGIPVSVSSTTNMDGELSWQIPYTAMAFGLSLLLAFAITYLVEKPAGKFIDRRISDKNKLG